MLVGCKSHERSAWRKDYRNGYWRRWITLKGGRLEIRMPRIRGVGEWEGEALVLVATDGNAGLESAVDIVYPFVKRQRCRAHKLGIASWP